MDTLRTELTIRVEGLCNMFSHSLAKLCYMFTSLCILRQYLLTFLTML